MLVYQRVGGYTTHIRNHPHPFSESQQHCNVFNLKNVRPMTQIYFGIHHLCHFAKIYQNIPCILDPHILVYFGIHHPIFEGNRCGSIPLPFWSLWQSPGRHVDDHFQESHRSSGQRHRKKNSRMKQNLGSAGYSATVFFLLQRWNALPSHMFWSKRLAMISGSCLQATNLCSFTCMICALYIYIY